MTKIVNEESFTIGRSMDCTIPLTEDSISRVHIVVTHRLDQVWIEDKGSSNGTYVNNVRVEANSLINIVPTDRIRVGKSEYILNISLELEEREDGIVRAGTSAELTDRVQASIHHKKNVNPSQPVETPESNSVFRRGKEKATKNTLQKTSPLVPKLDIKETSVEARQHRAPEFEGERILHEAHKKAAQIIYEGEVQAEKRAQAIYIEARERQAEAENYYKKRIQEAHKQADAILQSLQSQGEELLVQARRFAQEIRDEVDVVSQGLRDAARKEAEDIVLEARKEAESLKHDAYEKARTKAEIEAEDHLASAKAESQDILNFAKQQAEEMLTKARTEMEDELKDLKKSVEDKRKQIQAFKKEQEDLHIKSLGEREELEGKIAELRAEHQQVYSELSAAKADLNDVRSEEAALREKISDQKKATEELEHKIGSLFSENKTLERKNKDLQEQVGLFKLDIKAVEEKKRMLEIEFNQQKIALKDRLEKENQQSIKNAEANLQEAQLELNKRLQKLEREMLEEIMSRKEKLVRDIIIVIETRIAKVLEPAKWDQVSGLIFTGISETLEGKSVTFNGNSNVPKQSASLQRKKTRENLGWMYGGITAGILLSFLGIEVFNRVTSDKNPMRTIAAEESRRKKEDLERRKFNPAQVKDVKDSYTDSVLYTEGYSAAYRDPDYQQKLYKAASTYLLKTWRVDEDKSIQVLSMSTALIKELQEKKQSIHPDYVKDGLQKMRNLEKESLDRMKVILGSEVRLESYRRFENKFFETEILKK